MGVVKNVEIDSTAAAGNKDDDSDVCGPINQNELKEAKRLSEGA